MRNWLLTFGTVLVISAGPPAFAQSDTNPWQVADRMLESLGGREVWASARALYIRERAFPASLGEPIKAEFWRDLEVPAYRSIIVGPSIRRETRWSEKGGWVNRNGVHSELTEDAIRANISDWRQEPYVMYHKLAIRDSSLHLELANDNRLELFDGENGKLLCWFVVDVSGALLIWGNYYEGEISEHVYGPMRDFGQVSMPAWGTSTTGSWRFEYEDVVPMAEPLDIEAN